jgi:preprotein translocase SecE subunit
MANILTSNPLVRYVKESASELKQVAWPSRQTIVLHTMMVAVISLAVAAILGGLDFGFAYGLEKLISR